MNNSTWVNKYDDKLDETKSQNLYRFFAGWHGSSRSPINLTSAHICSLDAAELSPPPRRRLSLLSEWICEKSRKRRNPSSFSLALSLSCRDFSWPSSWNIWNFSCQKQHRKSCWHSHPSRIAREHNRRCKTATRCRFVICGFTHVKCQWKPNKTHGSSTRV